MFKKIENGESGLSVREKINDNLQALFEISPDVDWTIGTAGTVGYGFAPTQSIPLGWTRVAGHFDKTSPGYSRVIDPNGSVMSYVPKFYVKRNADNTVETSPIPAVGFVIDPAFLNAGAEMNGFFMDFSDCGNVGGVFVAQPGLDPCSTSSTHNPISNLNGTPPNRYGGIYAAVATRGVGYNVPTLAQWKALATLAKAHADASPTTTACAWIDVLPYAPKGNNNNALKDTNDSSVTFTASGYSNCALTGSGVPFSKTTHNGQAGGIADVNGNIWKIASGFTLFEAVPGSPAATDFKILKRSVDVRDIVNDDTTPGSGGAYDPDLYDAIDLTGYVAADLTNRYGNGTETVFEMSTDIDSAAYKRASVGVPTALGRSVGGSTAFGNDYFREFFRNQLAPLVGGYWSSGSSAGVFALDLYYARADSYGSVGGRASFFL